MMRFIGGMSDSVAWSSRLEWFAGGMAVRATIVLIVATVVASAMRHRSAAARHLVWATALVGVLALPLAQAVLPAWRVLPAADSATIALAGEMADSSSVGEREPGRLAASVYGDGDGTATETAGFHNLNRDDLTTQQHAQVAARGLSPDQDFGAIMDPQAASTNGSRGPIEDREGIVTQFDPSMASVSDVGANLRRIVGLVWLIGAAIFCLPMLLGALSVWRLHRAAQPMPSTVASELRRLAAELRLRRRVTGVLSADRQMPMTWGLLNPVLLLPAEAVTWTSERRRLVLLHELAHIQRWDCLTQLLGQLARALHWFNPLVWLALSRLRIEQERACDDCVLNAGANADDYAAELLSVTTRLPRATWDTAVALAMSRASRLEQRLAAILDADCERRPISTLRVIVLMAMLGFVVAGIGAAQRQTAAAAPPTAKQIALPDPSTNDSSPQTSEATRDSAKQAGAVNSSDAAEANPQVARFDAVNDDDPNRAAQPAAKQAAANDKAPATENATSLEAVIQQIEQNSAVLIDKSALNDAAIRGVLESLKDPYIALITPEQMKEFNQQLTGKVAGIGAALAKEDVGIVVTSLMPNSPALRGGLKPRDVIVEVNGQAANDLADAVKAIRGPIGTDVTLKIRKPDKQESQLTLKRGEVRVPSVKGLSLDEQGQWRHWLDAGQKMAFVQIAVFDNQTEAELKATLNGLQAQDLKGLVLDLRGNPGGTLPEALKVAQLFLKDADVLKVRGRPGAADNILRTGPEAPFVDVPLVVLVDPATASAAEVLATALKDNNRAILIGERTFGKGSVQTIFPLGESGSTLKLTTAQIFSPSGQPLHRSPDAKSWGVDPLDGYFVPLTSEQRTARQKLLLDRETGRLSLPQPVTAEFAEKDLADPQLAAALKSMSAKLKTGEFAKTGRPIAELQAQLDQRDELCKQRDDLRRKLEQLDRELGEKP